MPHHDGFSHEYATVNGLRYHYVRAGSGAPLFLVHGWPGFYYEWRLNIEPLSRHFDVVVPDMRGYAYTDKPDLPPEEGYVDTAFAEDIRALADQLAFQRISLVSHDFGSAWVQRFARLYPERVERLVFFQPVYPGIGMRWLEPGRAMEAWYMMFHQLPWAEDLVGSSHRATELYIRHFLSHWSHNKDVWTDEDVDAYTEAFSQPGALRGGFNCYRAAFRTAGRPPDGDLKVHAPTLVLWAEKDPILPVAWSDKLGDFFTDLTFRRVPDTGHFVMREQPELVNQSIIDFVGAVAAK